MKYNPITTQLFTDEGELIKELYCPLSKEWNKLNNGYCESCSKTVHDTSKMSDQEVLDFVKQNPKACLKVDLLISNFIYNV
jgi:hypothetical protein